MARPARRSPDPSPAEGAIRSVRLAKITQPKLPPVFLRSRLFRRLDEARRSPLVWVSGLPGSGKTTLVASYVGRRRLACLWYQMDEGDGDVATFFYYLGLAAQKAAPRWKKPLPALMPEYRAGLVTFARRYFRELCSRLGSSFVIVFDNYHLVPPDSSLHALMAEALGEIPEGGRAILVSRGDPPPALARLRANGTMDFVGGDEMRLTLRESLTLARLWGPQSRRDVTAAHERVQGWAAGLVLSLARPGAAEAAPPRDGTPSAIFDYFAGEIFERVDEPTRTFLVETALLPRTTADMADELTGMQNTARLLDRLARERYFTMRAAEPNPSYEYHPLFREFLLAQGEAILPPARRMELRRAAATLFEKEGRAEEALQPLREAGAWTEVARLLVQQAPALLRAGRSETLLRWAQLLPPEVAQAHPWLLYWLGLSVLPADPARARRDLQAAYDLFWRGEEPRGAYLSWAAVVESFLYEWDDFAPLDRWIDAFAELRRRWPEFPGHEVEERATSAIFVALMYRQPHHPDLPQWEARARGVAFGGSSLRVRVAMGHQLLFFYTWWSNDLAGARMVLDALRPLAAGGDVDPLTAIIWRCTEANYHCMCGSYQACLEEVEKGIALARESGVHLWDFMLLGQGAYGALAGNDLAQATRFAESLGSAHDHARRGNLFLSQHVSWILAMRRGDAQAVDLARAMLETARRAGYPIGESGCHAYTARALLASGKEAEGMAHLEEAERTARAMRSYYVESVCLLTRAVHARRKNDAQALEHLRRLLELVKERGFLTHLSYDPAEMSELWAMALERGIEEDLVRRLIREHHFAPTPSAMDLENWPWLARIRALGPFAIEKDGAPGAGGRGRAARKVQKKPLQLLKVLVAMGGGEASEDRLGETLWADAEGDVAHHALEMTVHRLRKLLGHEGAVRVREGRVALDPNLCWVDAWAFERRAKAALAALAQREVERGAALGERALALYRGPFLEVDEDQPWALECRGRLEGLRRRLTEALPRRPEHPGRRDEARP